NTVTFRVRNAGRRKGSTVAELYLTIPRPSPAVIEPPRQLKAFQAVTLRRGRSARVRLRLDSRSFSFWDVSRNRWAIPGGCFTIAIGRSSRDLPLRAVVNKGVGGVPCVR